MRLTPGDMIGVIATLRAIPTITGSDARKIKDLSTRLAVWSKMSEAKRHESIGTLDRLRSQLFSLLTKNQRFCVELTLKCVMLLRGKKMEDFQRRDLQIIKRQLQAFPTDLILIALLKAKVESYTKKICDEKAKTKSTFSPKLLPTTSETSLLLSQIPLEIAQVTDMVRGFRQRGAMPTCGWWKLATRIERLKNSPLDTHQLSNIHDLVAFHPICMEQMNYVSKKPRIKTRYSDWILDPRYRRFRN